MAKTDRVIEWLRATQEALCELREELDMLSGAEGAAWSKNQSSEFLRLRDMIGRARSAAQTARLEFQHPGKEDE